MTVQSLGLPGILVFRLKVFRDHRGSFFESWNEKNFREAGLDVRFVQDNVAYSKQGVLRGLHYQHPRAQGKLVTVVSGKAYDVMVDIRKGSPTFGQWRGIVIDADEPTQIYIPAGFAHGYVALTDNVTFSYKVTEFYDPAGDRSILWNDPDIGITWPIPSPTLSEKDQVAPRLRDVPDDQLPDF